MNFTFYKYQGTGNDFVILDNRNLTFPKNNTKLIHDLCDRRYGIGADGLMLLENDELSDFRMVYFNSDGSESSMCGNGGRCLTAFAQKLGVIDTKTTFIAVDGLHHATFTPDQKIALQMIDVETISVHEDYVFLNTGSPHHVTFVNNLKTLDVKSAGAAIRYSDLYGAAGSNVNFVTQLSVNEFRIRTYERGVEDETLSCGTGATAVAIAMHKLGKTTSNQVIIQVEGGQLEVRFEEQKGTYKNVFLVGPATFVFEGQITY